MIKILAIIPKNECQNCFLNIILTLTGASAILKGLYLGEESASSRVFNDGRIFNDGRGFNGNRAK